MEHNCIYQIFNNSSVVAIVTVLVGGFFAVWQYTKYKKIDNREQNKKELLVNLETLNKKVKTLSGLLSEISEYTRYNLEKNKTEKDLTDKDAVINRFQKKIDHLNKVSNNIYPRVSDLLYTEIPIATAEVQNKISVYFSEDRELNKNFKNYKEKLNLWIDSLKGGLLSDILKQNVDIDNNLGFKEKPLSDYFNDILRSIS